MTVDQLAISVLVSSRIWGPRPAFCYCQTVVGLLMWGAFSDERTCLLFTFGASPRQHSHSCVWILWDLWPNFTLSDLRLPQSGQPGSHIYIYISPRNRVAQLYPQALGSLFVACCDSGLQWRYLYPPPHGQSPCNPFIKDYTKIFYMIDKGDIPSIRCRMSFKGPESMRNVDGLRLIFIDFYVPMLPPCLNSTDLTAAYIQVSLSKRPR
jgi:hypothetical protein